MKDKQPTGIIEVGEVYTREALDEVQEIFAAYDGSVPYPEHYARYAQTHTLKFDHSEAVKLIIPLNDPRQKEAAITTELKIEGKFYRGLLYPVEDKS